MRTIKYTAIKYKTVVAVTVVMVAIALVVMQRPAKVEATVLTVPGFYPTIQSAINSARNGDTIQVANGVYRENIEIVGKYVTIAGNPDAQSVILAGNPGKTPIMIQRVPAVPGGKTVITGLKITGGSSPDGQGGGITIANDADPEIYNNTIENNYSVAHGGGILVYNGSDPIIRNNVIRQNTCRFFGAGVVVLKNSNASIINNTITDNLASGGAIANGGASGGGIYLENDSSNSSIKSRPVIIGNTIANNQSDFAGGGIMLRVGVDAYIEGNTISNNATAYGGGIHIETEGSSPTIGNNTIMANTASEKSQYPGSGFGGGISVYNRSNPTIYTNNISNNQSTSGGAGVVMAEGSSTQLLRNSIKNNAVTGGGFVQGGGIYISSSTATAANNQISDNSAYLGGGVAAIGSNAKLTLTHNTIAYNSAVHVQGGGGLFVNNNPGTLVVSTDNIFTGNNKYQVFEQYGAGNQYPRTQLANNTITNSGSGLYFNYVINGVSSASMLDASTAVDAAATSDDDPGFADAAGRNLALGASSAARGGSQTSIADDIRSHIRSDGASDRGAFEFNATPITKATVYRFWSPVYRAHFYTISQSERDAVIASHLSTEWLYEGLGYGAFTSAQAGITVPLYRFYSHAYGGHFYTVSDGERDSLIANPTSSNWRYEGIAFHVYPSSTNAASYGVYRFWSPLNRHHFYTASTNERDYVQASFPSSQWTYEGLAYKIPQ